MPFLFWEGLPISFMVSPTRPGQMRALGVALVRRDELFFLTLSISSRVTASYRLVILSPTSANLIASNVGVCSMCSWFDQ
jgi:hypothetical protein